MTPFEEVPPIRQLLPELELRQLRDAYDFEGFVRKSSCSEVYLQMVDDQCRSYTSYVGHPPSPLVLRAQVAGIIHDRDEVERYIYDKIPAGSRGEPAQLEAIALALAGTLIAIWLQRTTAISSLGASQDDFA